MTNEADKPSVEGLMDDLEYAVLARCQGHGSNACVKECRERLASEAAPAAQPATPLREVLSDEKILELAGNWLVTGENQLRYGHYYYRSHGTSANVRDSDLIAFARALLAASSDEARKT